MSKPLGLIHGGLLHGRAWDPFLDALKLDVDPIRIELPGHGDAEDWDDTRDYNDQALEIALAALPSAPVPLVGHSYGAVVALRLAVERPARVSSLVLIEPVFYAAIAGDFLFEKMKRDMAKIARKVSEGQAFTAARQFMDIWGDGSDWADVPAHVKSYATERMELIMATEGLVWDDLPGVLAPGRLEALEMPVTLVEGGASPNIIPEIVNALGRRFKDGEGITVPEANHMLAVTHPVPVAEAVRERLVW